MFGPVKLTLIIVEWVELCNSKILQKNIHNLFDRGTTEGADCRSSRMDLSTFQTIRNMSARH